MSENRISSFQLSLTKLVQVKSITYSYLVYYVILNLYKMHPPWFGRAEANSLKRSWNTTQVGLQSAADKAASVLADRLDNGTKMGKVM